MTRRWKKICCFLLHAMEELIAPLDQSILLFWGKPSEHLSYKCRAKIFIPYYPLFFGKDGE